LPIEARGRDTPEHSAGGSCDEKVVLYLCDLLWSDGCDITCKRGLTKDVTVNRSSIMFPASKLAVKSRTVEESIFMPKPKRKGLKDNARAERKKPAGIFTHSQ